MSCKDDEINPFLEIDRGILADSGTSNDLQYNLLELCDRIGTRFPGTDGYRQAADFMLEKFNDYGLDNAYLEAFNFNAWKRGVPAECRMIAPDNYSFNCYALPNSAASGKEGIEAEIIDIGVGGEAEVKAKTELIPNRLVLTNASARPRQEIYAHCIKLGAKGFILGNNTPGGMLITGSVGDQGEAGIPAVSISNEDAEFLRRKLEQGNVKAALYSDCNFEKSTTWNVVGELTGSEKPDELVIIGGHLDSHEIGPGAFDNAAGAVFVMEVARLLAEQRDQLKRTVRFIGFAAEEIGLLGSHYHAAKHAEELQKARFMLNCDMPSLGRPRGLAFHECPKGKAYLEKLSKQMNMPLICQNRSHCHSDHYPFILQGVATAGIAGGKNGAAVNHFAHMAGDTPDKISCTDMRDSAAFAARFLLRASNDEQWPDMRRSAEDVQNYGK